MKYLTTIGILISGLAGIISCESADTSTADCKNDQDCKGNGICLESKCVSAEEKDGYTIQPETTAPKTCDLDIYQTQCNDLVLTYCDVNTNLIQKLDCQEQGFSHCGYVDFVERNICYGNKKQGQHCSKETQYGDQTLLQSECDFTQVDVCTYVDDINKPYSICTILCDKNSDCPEGPEDYGCYPINEDVSEKPASCEPDHTSCLDCP